ncbi:MAG: hypothetical protein MJ228_03270 [Bacilli bacterium]|nr:hypothetical protein [Bacilli bacterium]
MAKMNILIPFKVLKKHPIIHLLWFVFVPFLSSVGVIFNLLNFNLEGVYRDISLGFFYCVSLSITLSIVYDIVVDLCEHHINHLEKRFLNYKVVCLLALISVIIALMLFQFTLVGRFIVIQIALHIVSILIAFYTRLVTKMDAYLNENCEYIEEENDRLKSEIKKSKKGGKKGPDGGELKI